MKLIILLLIAATLNAEFLQTDKKYHAAAGLLSYSACVVVGDILRKNDVTDWWDSETCVLVPIAVGAAKEGYDALGYGTPDFNDFTATAFPPMLVSYTWNFKGF